MPWCDVPTEPAPTRMSGKMLHTPLVRVNTHAAPVSLLYRSPPMSAVLPSADTDTEIPWCAIPSRTVPQSLSPCWVHAPLICVKIHMAPVPSLSLSPPTTTVVPSADTATELPCPAIILETPVPTSLICEPLVRLYTHAAPAPPLSARARPQPRCFHRRISPPTCLVVWRAHVTGAHQLGAGLCELSSSRRSHADERG